eukprot:748880-Hanusia_phi.AAC.9
MIYIRATGPARFGTESAGTILKSILPDSEVQFNSLSVTVTQTVLYGHGLRALSHVAGGPGLRDSPLSLQCQDVRLPSGVAEIGPCGPGISSLAHSSSSP